MADRIIELIADRDCLLRDYLRKRYSGRRIHYLRGGKCMFVDGKEVTVNAKIEAGQKITLVFSENEEFPYEPKDMKLKIVYEDDDVAVIEKPFGVASMPVAPHFSANLLNGLAFLKPNTVFRVVTRLDKDTSGLVLVAKNALAHSLLHENIRKIQKFYTAVVYGNLKAPVYVSAPIASGKGDKRFVSDSGNKAFTEIISSLCTEDEKLNYFVKKVGKAVSVVKIKTYTGRTHQIRVHSAFIGHPLVGDDLYGGSNLFFPADKDFQGESFRLGHLLCCSGITFTHPITQNDMSFFIDGVKNLAERVGVLP